MKRRFDIKSGKGNDEIRSLEDGIPRLRRTISETGPSIPSEEEHASVSWTEKPFGLLSQESWMTMKDRPSRLFTQKGLIVYSSENDIAALVKYYLLAIVSALGLDDEVELHSEIGAFNIRPDLLVVSTRGVPVGVVEVKKPDIQTPNGRTDALAHPNVLGELYNFMKLLPNFYGVSPVFGIVTNMNEWRMAWLPGEGVDEIATQDEENENQMDSDEAAAADETESTTSISRSGDLHLLTQDVEDEEDDCDELDKTVRHFSVSQKFTKTDNATLVRAISSIICKMVKSQVHPYATPFDKLNERTILKFVKGSATGVVWTRLKNVVPKWDAVAAPRKYLFAIEDLGRGANGRVWLTCSSSGALCVLKFSIKDKLQEMVDESKMWKIAYPNISVHVEFWCGHPALRMPHFSKVDDAGKVEAISLVKSTLRENFAERGLKHRDVFWRNIGWYRLADGTKRAVVFDMGSVVSSSTPAESDWVEKACESLLRDDDGMGETDEDEY